MDGTDEEERRNTQVWEVFDRQAKSSFPPFILYLSLSTRRVLRSGRSGPLMGQLLSQAATAP